MVTARSKPDSAFEPLRAVAAIAHTLAHSPALTSTLAPTLRELLGVEIEDTSPAERAVLVYLASQMNPDPRLDCAYGSGGAAPGLRVADWLSVDPRLLAVLNDHCAQHGKHPIVIDPPLPPRDLRRCLGGIGLREYEGFYRGLDLPAGEPAEFVFDLEPDHAEAALPSDLAFVGAWVDPVGGEAVETLLVKHWEVTAGQLHVQVPVPERSGNVRLLLDVYVRDASDIIRRATVLDHACTAFERGHDDYGIVHLHIRCTAGIALTDFFRARCGDEAVAEGYRFGPDGPTSFKSLQVFSERFAGGRFAACHFRRDFFRGSWPRKLFFAIVREPLDRALSMYNFYRRYCLEHGEEMVRNWQSAGFSFESVRETWERHTLFEDDSMCRYLSGRPSFRATLERLGREQRVVGCFDDRQPWLDYLADLVGVEAIALPDSMVAPNGGYREELLAREPGLEAFLYDHNREDLALYRHCRAERLIVNVSPEVEAGLRRRFAVSQPGR